MLRQAAENGNSDAQFCLGQRQLSHYHEGAARDAEALKWLRLSAGQGNARAQARLGLVYFTGRLMPQDFAEAARWYRRAADAGDRNGEQHLAQMYREGKGVPVDFHGNDRSALPCARVVVPDLFVSVVVAPSRGAPDSLRQATPTHRAGG